MDKRALPVFSLMRRLRFAESTGLVAALVAAFGASLAVTALSPFEYRWLLDHRIGSHAATATVAIQMIATVSLWLVAPAWPYISWSVSGKKEVRRFAVTLYARARDLESAGVDEAVILATFLADCRRRYLRSLLRPYSRYASPVPSAYRAMGQTLCGLIRQTSWPEAQARDAQLAALASERAFMRLMLWSGNRDSRWAKRLLGRFSRLRAYPVSRANTEAEQDAR